MSIKYILIAPPHTHYAQRATRERETSASPVARPGLRRPALGPLAPPAALAALDAPQLATALWAFAALAAPRPALLAASAARLRDDDQAVLAGGGFTLPPPPESGYGAYSCGGVPPGTIHL